MVVVRRSRSSPSLQAAERGLGVRLRHIVGLRQTFTVAGVRYREHTTQRLRHALSRQGPGYKDYEVVFPGAMAMQIRATPQRVFADLTGPRLLPVYQRAASILRPGMRALLLESGTGYAAEWVATRVAPSGAVVALDRDHTAIAYAQKRYVIPNVSFELGGVEALAGETDGAFNAVIAVDAIGSAEDSAAVVRELWRAVAPAGWLMIAAPAALASRAEVHIDDGGAVPPGGTPTLHSALADAIGGARGGSSEPERAPVPPTISTLGDERDGWTAIAAFRPAEQ
jgi:2-polyprenyl-3-methyl-5-hydroxy-6-metoxy-1,4-benzoquinol methylase